MTTFESFLYKPNPKKAKEDQREIVYIGASIAVLVSLWIFFVRGFLGFSLFGGISGALIKLKVDDINKKGASRFGSLTKKLSLSAERLLIGDTEFKLVHLENFTILADDYLGKPAQFFTRSGGIDNYIEFKRNGVEYSFQFQVKRQGDFKILAQVSKEIKESVQTETIHH